MRVALIVIIAIVQLAATSLAGFACPPGYARCGTHYCCPQ